MKKEENTVTYIRLPSVLDWLFESHNMEVQIKTIENS